MRSPAAVVATLQVEIARLREAALGNEHLGELGVVWAERGRPTLPVIVKVCSPSRKYCGNETLFSRFRTTPHAAPRAAQLTSKCSTPLRQSAPNSISCRRRHTTREAVRETPALHAERVLQTLDLRLLRQIRVLLGDDLQLPHVLLEVHAIHVVCASAPLRSPTQQHEELAALQRLGADPQRAQVGALCDAGRAQRLLSRMNRSSFPIAPFPNSSVSSRGKSTVASSRQRYRRA